MLDQNEIDSLKYARRVQELYNAAGRPQYEGDLTKNREAVNEWRNLLRSGDDLAVTCLVLEKIKGGQLSPREEELTKRLQANTSVAITLRGFEEKYPTELVTLAQRSLDLRASFSGGDTLAKLEYLEVKLEVEVRYLQLLIED